MLKYDLFQLEVCPKKDCISTVGVKQDLFARNPAHVPITDFFGAIRPVEITYLPETVNNVLY